MEDIAASDPEAPLQVERRQHLAIDHQAAKTRRVLLDNVEHPIGKLVLNDIGTVVPKAALERLAKYVGHAPSFGTLEELQAYVQFVSAPFGPLTDAQWHHLTAHSARQLADGSWTTAYDPAIGIPFQKGPLTDINLWEYWDSIRCPTLLLRGVQSDLLLRDNALAMTQRGPRPRLVEFEGIGHAPALMAADQIAVVRDFLLAPA